MVANPNRSMMTAHLSDEQQWAVGLGARLRLLQASFADDDPSTRRDYLREEIDRAIRDIPMAKRAAHLAALAERFPEGEESPPEEAAAASPVAVASAEPSAGEESPEVLIEKLAAMAHQMPEAVRQNIALRLHQAGLGFAPAAPAPVSGRASEDGDEIPPELQKKLGLDPSQTIDRKRAMRFTASLIDLVVTMDQVCWTMWKNLAPNSIVRRDPGATGDLRRMAGPFLVGDPEVSTAQINQLLDKTRQLMAGLLAAIGATGETFARSFMTKFSPQNIKEIADAEPGFFIGPEQKCWRKYMQLFDELSGVAIEKEIANAIAKYTEDLILGASRPPGSTHAGI